MLYLYLHPSLAGRGTVHKPGACPFYKADVWSVGGMALYLWYGYKPGWLDTEPCHTPGEVASCMKEQGGTADRDPPAGLLDLVGSCLLADPAQRKTARELLALPWFEEERCQVLARAQARGPVTTPASPAATGSAAAGATAARMPSPSTSWGPALEALVEEWCRA